MSKCIYCKKYGKDQYRCEITKTIRNYPCKAFYDWEWGVLLTTSSCKYCKANLFVRFAKWLGDKLHKG